jgi:uncharacterized protein
MKIIKIHKIFGKLVEKTEDIKKGLMYRKKQLGKNEGMLFNMGKSNIHSFWMKNTYISLDVIFLNSNLRVIGIVENNKPLSLKSISINQKSRYVLEMNGGQAKKNNINIGDYIEFIY